MNPVLGAAGVDRFCEAACEKFYSGQGRPSVPPGVYFRMLMIGYFDRETHDALFDWMLKRVKEHGLLSGGPTGIDASTMDANAAMKSIVRRDTGEGYREFIAGLAAVDRNRRRRHTRRSKTLHRRRGELVERSVEHLLDGGGMQRTWVTGIERVRKRYLVHAATIADRAPQEEARPDAL